MSYFTKHAGFQLKKLSLLLLLTAGVCTSAFAQTSAPSLPSLSGMPDVQYNKPATIPSLSSPTASSPASVTTGLPSLSGLPPLPTVESARGLDSAGSAKGSTKPPVLAGDVIAQQPPAATIPDVQVTTNPSPQDPLGMTALPLPNSDILPIPGAPPMAMPADAGLADSASPLSIPTAVAAKEQPRKTWITDLAPSYTPKKMDYTYKRNLLSESIYRNQYDKNNSHLPRRITRDDYVHLLFDSVASNDLDATRALLNAGVRLSATNPYGETPLMLAQRMGSNQVAALLVARGAKE